MTNYPTYKLGEIIDKVPIEFKVKQKDYLPKGKFPVVDQGQPLIGGYTDDETLLVKTELPVIVFGDHTKVKKFVDFPFVAGADGTKIIKPKKDYFIEPKLFYWFLHCVKFPDKGYARHFQYLLKSDIALPPLPTQHAIVTRIETLFAELDKAVQHLRTAQQQLKTYRQAVLNETMNATKFVPVGEVITEMGQGWSPKCCNEPSTSENEWGVIKTTAIQSCCFIEEENKKLPENLEPRLKHELKAGDILITRAGPKVRVGVCCLIKKTRPKLINCDKAYRVVLNRDMIDAQYFEYVINSPTCIKKLDELKTGISDSGVNLTQSRFYDLQIPLPPLTDQHRIVQEIESRLSQAEAAEASIAEALQKTEALRQSILKKAFSGELV